jgi:predicted metalloprotease with PDZ domain
MASALSAAQEPLRVRVDAGEAPLKIFHARLTIPTAPGPLTLLYPKWIPGEHGPSGPIANLAGLRFSAAGRPLSWTRDPLEMFAFKVEVPAGASAVEVELDYLSPTEGKFSSGASATARLAVLSWNTVLLYPAGQGADRILCQASLRLPPGWSSSTALPVAKESGETVDYRPVSLATLVDSPVILGRHFRSRPLLEGQTPPHRLDLVADSAAALEMAEEQVRGYEAMVTEAGAMFGGRPYRAYRWLITLSDGVEHFGLEHHESSDNRRDEKTLSVDWGRRGLAGLLAHEYAHAWNGKYRRPAELATPDYQQPWNTGLLWVYEGLTDYLGSVLPARSGLWSPEEFRESLAHAAAELDHHKGREWRPLIDTAVSAQILHGAAAEWKAWRRSTDYYDEGVLLWLEADVLIRANSGGRRSLDDFLQRFHGGQNEPAVKPYSFDDVVAALNEVEPYDWRRFWNERVYSTRERAPLGGIEQGGWKRVYSDKPNTFISDYEKRFKRGYHLFSIGLIAEEEGKIRDVVPGLAAAAAGLGPGMKIVAVNGRRFTLERLSQAVKLSSEAAVELIVENGEFFAAHRLDYKGGERQPHLERDERLPDLLSGVSRPRVVGGAQGGAAGGAAGR